MKDSIIIVGAGGHCHSCIDVIDSTQKYLIKGIVGLESEYGKTILGYKVTLNDNDLILKKYNHLKVFVSLGWIKDPSLKILMFARLKLLNFELPSIISNCAYVSQDSKIGAGTIVMHKALVNAGANIGENCIVNTGAIIEHNTSVMDHCHISTGAILNGNVNVGAKVFVGSGAIIKNGVSIGENCFIGMGVKVFNDISPNSILI
jgi:sugar O-acyltransferase (sialic acid O-acetyltransferase NeuD family)